MSFFQNITRDLKGLGLGDKRNEPRDGTPLGSLHSPAQLTPPATREYGSYGPDAGPPPAQFHAAPLPPTYKPPSDRPPLPPG